MADLHRYQQAQQQESDDKAGEWFYVTGNHNYSDVISSVEYNSDGLYLYAWPCRQIGVHPGRLAKGTPDQFMDSNLTPKISIFFVYNLRNSSLLRAIIASNMNILDRNLLRPELIRCSLMNYYLEMNE